MTYRYTREIIVHFIIGLVICAVVFIIYDLLALIITLIVSIFFATTMHNCYRIDISQEEIIIFRIYDGQTKLCWENISTIEMDKNTKYYRRVGFYRDMVIKVDGQKDVEINIEPIQCEDLITHIETICKDKGIPFKEKD